KHSAFAECQGASTSPRIAGRGYRRTALPWETPFPTLPLLGGGSDGPRLHRASPSPLLHRSLVEAAVEPVLVAGDVLLHHDVDVGLVERNARDVGEGEIDEAFDVLVVGRGVAGRSRGDSAVDQRVHRLRLVAHRVEDRILAVIAPDEEVFGI